MIDERSSSPILRKAIFEPVSLNGLELFSNYKITSNYSIVIG